MNKEIFSITSMSKVLKVSRSGFYEWLDRPESKRTTENAVIASKIRVIHSQSRETYGSPRVYNELTKQNISCSENRVARIMAKEGIVSLRHKGFKPQNTDSRHDLPVAENILAQDFTASAPNQKWVGDITYIWTKEGWLYLAVVIDLFSRRVVGWATSIHPDSALVVRAFEMAQHLRGNPEGVIFHSDRGSQYASWQFRQRLKAAKATLSMSRKGNCYDNAVSESFFNTLKSELVYPGGVFDTRWAARTRIYDFIGTFYNFNRIHSSLGVCSPVDFEQEYQRKIKLRSA